MQVELEMVESYQQWKGRSKILESKKIKQSLQFGSMDWKPT